MWNDARVEDFDVFCVLFGVLSLWIGCCWGTPAEPVEYAGHMLSMLRSVGDTGYESVDFGKEAFDTLVPVGTATVGCLEPLPMCGRRLSESSPFPPRRCFNVLLGVPVGVTYWGPGRVGSR